MPAVSHICPLSLTDKDAADEILRDGNYLGLLQQSAWSQGLEVERGKSRQRLDMRHGFVKSIVRRPPTLV